jgi:ribonuclease BN (tRNA processing enzyme)
VSFAVTVLGSAAMFATKERACSGYLLEVAGKRLWMDAGGGSWRNLQNSIDLADIDGVVLSHRHPDHTIDLFQCFHARRYGNPEPMEVIPLWAPAETIERLVGFSPELEESFDIQVVAAGETAKLDDIGLSFFEMVHPAETLGIRAEFEGAALAYSSDTGPGGDLAGLAAGADLFICEATFQDSDEEWKGHMRASQAGTAASDAGAERLLLSHLPAGRDVQLSLAEAQRTSGDVRVELAFDGLKVEI